MRGLGIGAGARRLIAAAPAHAPGLAVPGSTQGSRYVHPEISTYIGELSAALFHPLPGSAVCVTCSPLAAVTVLAVSVWMVPVGVYASMLATTSPRLIEAGGHPYCAVTEAGMLPAPAPPVCQDWRGGVQGLMFPQVPSASRGSSGIQPFSRPSWYDQAGVSTTPLSEELPIFQVQKK